MKITQEELTILMEQTTPLPYKQYFRTGAEFQAYAVRIDKHREIARLKERYVANGLGVNHAWHQAATRYGWFESWTEEEALLQLQIQINQGRFHGTPFATMPMPQWQDYVRRTLTINLPNPVPYCPPVKVTMDGERLVEDKALGDTMVTPMEIERDLTWAYENIGKDKVIQGEAPSAAAYMFWKTFSEDHGEFTKMFTDIYKKRKAREKQEGERRRIFEDDKRAQMSLIDKLAVEFQQESTQ